LFRISEVLGIADPFNMKMSRKAFIYWKKYLELKDIEFHEKWEYYIAQLNIDILSIMDGEQRTVKDRLIKFDSRTPEDIRDEQEKKDIEFFNKMAQIAKIKSKGTN